MFQAASSRCKGPETQTCLPCQRTSGEASVSGAERMRGDDVVSDGADGAEPVGHREDFLLYPE